MLLAAAQAASPRLALEIRVFHGTEEVTADTRVTVHRAADRGEPVAQFTRRDGPPPTVEPGIYDAQAVREQDGRVVSIRWAERLVVMPYPDEGGHHLEVINFENGYGALQVRAPRAASLPDVQLYPAGTRVRPAGAPLQGPGYALFVVRAGRYDIQVRQGARVTWHADIEVPLDRTRLWLIP
jgi:hypothetical protein